MATTRLLVERLKTKIGTLLVVTHKDDALVAVDWTDFEDRLHELLRRQHRPHDRTLQKRPTPSAAHRALEAYSAGSFTTFDSLRVKLGGAPLAARSAPTRSASSCPATV